MVDARLKHDSSKMFKVKLCHIVLSLRCNDEILARLHSHYDEFPHQTSGNKTIVFALFEVFLLPSSLFCNGPAGLPHEILQMDFYVPGSLSRKEDVKYKGKDVFQEVLTTTMATALCYVDRATKDLWIQGFKLEG